MWSNHDLLELISEFRRFLLVEVDEFSLSDESLCGRQIFWYPYFPRNSLESREN